MSARLNSTLLLVFLLLNINIAHGQAPENELRSWTSQDGKFTVQAKFIAYAGGIVRLNKDGRQLSVPIERLSDQDHRFISQSINWGHTWLDQDGKFLHVAKLDSAIDRTTIRLKSITGEAVTVKLASLGADSQ